MNGHQNEDVRRLERFITKVETLEKQYSDIEQEIASNYSAIRSDLEKMQVDRQRMELLIQALSKEFWFVRWIVLGFAGLIFTTFGVMLVNLVYNNRPAP